MLRIWTVLQLHGMPERLIGRQQTPEPWRSLSNARNKQKRLTKSNRQWVLLRSPDRSRACSCYTGLSALSKRIMHT